MTTCQACATPLPKGSRFCYACGSQVPGVGEGASAAETPSRAQEFLNKLRARLGAEYEVEREIGRGGMGIVYLAREKALDRHVALKVLPSVLAFDDSIVERFIREARLAARLDHPNIVPMYRVGQAGDITYFAMKYVTGGSLQGLLKNTPQLPLAEAQRILAACAHALGYAHARGIIHRDVKPANILLDTGGRVYVTDLGIAKAVAAESSLTASGAVVGTPMYMSPEQCRGEPADARSDQYALGIVGYQMLTGQLPFEGGKSMEGILYDRLFTDPEPLETHRPDVPIAGRLAIQRAMSRKAADRFPTMEEFAAAVMGDPPTAEVLATTPIGTTVRYPRGGVPTPA
ncbi:MAG: serine/threonine-protein kinase, partial [Gemmatimonadota bacterium]